MERICLKILSQSWYRDRNLCLVIVNKVQVIPLDFCFTSIQIYHLIITTYSLKDCSGDSVSWSCVPRRGLMMLLCRGDPVFQTFLPALLWQPAVSPMWYSVSVLSLLGQETARPIQCITGVSMSLFPPAPPELSLFCPFLGGCQVPCRDLDLRQ